MSSSSKTVLVGLLLVVAFGVAAAVAAFQLRSDSVAPPVDIRLGGPEGLRPDGGPIQEGVSRGERFALPDGALEPFPGRPPVRLADYRGAPLVVNFWASWCGPCVEEMPDLVRVARQSGDRVAFLGVDVRDDAQAAAAFAERSGVDYDLALDPQGAYFGAVRGIGMPTTLLVDANGTVVYRHTGGLDAAQLRDLLRTRLGV